MCCRYLVATFFVLGFCWQGIPPKAANAQSVRRALGRVQAMQNAQKQQAIKDLQAELQKAQSVNSQAESELVSATTSVQAAKSQLQSAKERYDAAEKDAHAAAKAQRELEEKLINSQSPDTPVGKARQTLEAAQRKLDLEVRRVLSLPPAAPSSTEADRAQERLKFTESQKSRLKADTACVKANESVEALRALLKEEERKLFEADDEWNAAHSRRQGLAKDMKALEENRRDAAAELAKYTKQMKAAQAQAAASQQAIATATAQLQALGAKPAAPATKK